MRKIHTIYNDSEIGDIWLSSTSGKAELYLSVRDVLITPELVDLVEHLGEWSLVTYRGERHWTLRPRDACILREYLETGSSETAEKEVAARVLRIRQYTEMCQRYEREGQTDRSHYREVKNQLLDWEDLLAPNLGSSDSFDASVESRCQPIASDELFGDSELIQEIVNQFRGLVPLRKDGMSPPYVLDEFRVEPGISTPAGILVTLWYTLVEVEGKERSVAVRVSMPRRRANRHKLVVKEET